MPTSNTHNAHRPHNTFHDPFLMNAPMLHHDKNAHFPHGVYVGTQSPYFPRHSELQKDAASMNDIDTVGTKEEEQNVAAGDLVKVGTWT